MAQVSVVKRKSNDNLVNDPKKQKFNEAISSCGVNCSSNGKAEKSSSSKKSISGLMMLTYGCFYCTLWNESIDDLYDHWSIAHNYDAIHPFLFHVKYRKEKETKLPNKTEQFHFVKLTNFQLKKLLAIEAVNQSTAGSKITDDDFEKKVEYLHCWHCKKKIHDSKSGFKYFNHIEMHARDIKAKNSEQDFEKLLKTIYSTTKVIFSNGMTLTKYNLMTTGLDDTVEFDKFIEKLLHQTPLIKAEQTEDDDDVILIEFKCEPTTVVSSTSSPSPSNQQSIELAELQKQRQHMNTLRIIGIPQRDDENVETLNKIVLRICRRLNVDISIENDILDVFRSSILCIGVKFNNIRKKDDILSCRSKECLYSNDIFDNLPKDQVNGIRIDHFMTRYYEDVNDQLKHALFMRKIHSFKLTYGGFAFRRTRNSEANIILSTEQFHEIMRRRD